jgi:hypothetical protein
MWTESKSKPRQPAIFGRKFAKFGKNIASAKPNLGIFTALVKQNRFGIRPFIVTT